MTRYIDIHTADGTRRVVAVTAEDEFVASFECGHGYSRQNALKNAHVTCRTL